MVDINKFSLDDLNNDSRNLIAVSKDCANNTAISGLVANLENAIAANFDADKPLIATLVGGTGSGKSKVFCKLINQDGVSPSSDTERNYTDKCFVYAPQEYIDNLLPSDWGDAKYVESENKGFVLVDTPDLDGAKEENVLQAKAMAEISDILIFVTDPEKYSNAVLHKVLKSWTASKRWYFVLNKADKIDVDMRKDIKELFVKRMKQLGFAHPEKNTYIISAKNSEKDNEFELFKNEIISDKSSVSNRLFHYWNKLNRYKNAVSKKIEYSGGIMTLKEYFERLRNELQAEENMILSESEKVIKNIIEEPDCKLSVKKSFVSELYSSMSARTLSFVSPYLWLARFFHRVKKDETKRELEEKINSSELLKSNYRKIMGFLQQKNLISWDYYKDFVLKPDFRLSDLCIREKADRITSGFKASFLLFLANLMPALLTCWVLYLSLQNLLKGTALTGDYFIQAGVALIFVSWVGGVLICGYLDRQKTGSLSFDLASKIINNQDNFAILREKKSQLEESLRLIEKIDERVKKEISQIEPHIQRGYGVGLDN